MQSYQLRHIGGGFDGRIQTNLFGQKFKSLVIYTDTVYHIKELKRKKQGNQEPWFVKG